MTPRTPWLLCPALALLTLFGEQLHADTLASNLSESNDSTGDFVISSDPYSHLGAAFKTPSTGSFTLESVTLPLKISAADNGNPLLIRIHRVDGLPDENNFEPGTGGAPITLTSPSFSTSGSFSNYTFTTAGIPLDTDTWYWITAETIGTGAYEWGVTSSTAATPDPIFPGFSQYNDFDSVWENFIDTEFIPLFEVTGTATGVETYATWSGGASQTADANNDGVTNLMAYALGAADINVNARSLLPTLTKQIGGGYKYTVPASPRTDVTYQIQMSTSTTLAGSAWTAGVLATGGILAQKTGAGAWTESVLGTEPNGIAVTPTANGVEVVDTNNTSRRFWRLVVSVP